MKFRIRIESFEVEIGGQSGDRLSSVLAPAVAMFLATYGHKLWPKTPPAPPAAEVEDDAASDDHGRPGQHVVDGEPPPSASAAEV